MEIPQALWHLCQCPPTSFMTITFLPFCYNTSGCCLHFLQLYSPCATFLILLSDILVSYKRTSPQHRYLAHVILVRNVSCKLCSCVPFFSAGNWRLLRGLCVCKKVFLTSPCSLLRCIVML